MYPQKYFTLKLIINEIFFLLNNFQTMVYVAMYVAMANSKLTDNPTRGWTAGKCTTMWIVKYANFIIVFDLC